MDAISAISRKVEQLLAVRGETRADLARALGKSSGWPSHKLTGRRPWTVEDLDELARYFSVSPATFLMDAVHSRATDTRQYQHQLAA